MKNLNSRKAPSYNLNTEKIFTQLLQKRLILTYLFNAALRLRHVPDSGKVAEVIMIPKAAKLANDVKFYHSDFGSFMYFITF